MRGEGASNEGRRRETAEAAIRVVSKSGGRPSTEKWSSGSNYLSASKHGAPGRCDYRRRKLRTGSRERYTASPVSVFQTVSAMTAATRRACAGKRAAPSSPGNGDAGEGGGGELRAQPSIPSATPLPARRSPSPARVPVRPGAGAPRHRRLAQA